MSPITEKSPSDPAQRYEAENIPHVIANLADGRCILRLTRSPGRYLEMAATPAGLRVSEQYDNKCLHRKGVLSPDEAVALVRRYEKESVSDARDWYPTLIRWRGLRIGHPRLFALLNETYRISNPLAMSALIGMGVVIFGLCFLLGIALHIRGKIIFLPLVLYALLVAKRVDFADSSKRSYGY